MYYFPNKSPETMALEARFRSGAADASEASRLTLYEVLTHSHPDLVDTRFQTEGEFVIADQVGRRIAFPRPLPMIKFSHISCGYCEWLKRKYTLPGFVEVEPGDVVVDCGGYVGGFAMSVVNVVTSIHLFEPEIKNKMCCDRNFVTSGNVEINLAGLFNRTGLLDLNVSTSSVEHSFLTPDDQTVAETRSVPVTTLDDYCASNAIERIDFAKVEAEGVEPEVIEGMRETRPAKLAIDVSPERNGLSPAEDIRLVVEDWGYQTKQRGHVLFARL